MKRLTPNTRVGHILFKSQFNNVVIATGPIDMTFAELIYRQTMIGKDEPSLNTPDVHTMLELDYTEYMKPIIDLKQNCVFHSYQATTKVAGAPPMFIEIVSPIPQ